MQSELHRKHFYAVIMAGGSGTRFWPLSRKTLPKQFLDLAGQGKSLLEGVLEHISALVPIERTIIVTHKSLAVETLKRVPHLPPQNLLAEPQSKNTAPCIAWAAHAILRRDPEALLFVFTADHFVSDGVRYQQALERAALAASEGGLVTFGVVPNRPETGYGYIEFGDEIGPGEARRVIRFVEKPDRAKAEAFLQSGRYLWNSGQFVFRAQAILKAIEAHMPELASAFEPLASAKEEELPGLIEMAYAKAPSQSIDHGVMEKAQNIWVVMADFGWSDVGSWTTAWELAPKDAQGNVGEALFVDARRNLVHTSARKAIVLIGVEDLVVVDTGDALLVVPRERSQEVKEAVQRLGGLFPEVL
ncbi:MAG: mannose-1-phosphate guanylyltransferase [Sandaracinaceae bacterium]|nr:mannose-1-phosphate guanylyltransferase [Sandaracinaceae bacterium]